MAGSDGGWRNVETGKVVKVLPRLTPLPYPWEHIKVGFDFNKNIGKDKTFAQYYEESMSEVNDKFQLVLKKYASKLSHRDIILLEHFGGGAYIFRIFKLMKFMSEAKFSSQLEGQKAKELKPFNNSFRGMNNENFPKHFEKLIELIDEYNKSVDSENDKWTIRNINSLSTIAQAFNDPRTNW